MCLPSTGCIFFASTTNAWLAMFKVCVPTRRYSETLSHSRSATHTNAHTQSKQPRHCCAAEACCEQRLGITAGGTLFLFFLFGVQCGEREGSFAGNGFL